MANRCINKIINASGLSDKEAAAVLEDMISIKAKELNGNKTLNGIGDKLKAEALEIGNEEIRIATNKKRNFFLNRERANETYKRVHELAETKGIDLIDAFAEHIHKTGDTQDGIKRKYYAELTRLTNEDKTGFREALKDPAFAQDTIRAIYGQKVDNPKAKELAKIINDVYEKMRVELNDLGADIGKLENYIPQSHDATKIKEAGRVNWKKDFIENLDWGKVTNFKSVKTENINTFKDEYADFIFRLLIYGEEIDSKIFDPNFYRNATVRQTKNLNAHRTLHFKDADAFFKYNSKYGDGNIFENFIKSIDSNALDMALISRYGDSAKDGIGAVINRIKGDMQKVLADGRMNNSLDAKQLKRLEKQFDKLEKHNLNRGVGKIATAFDVVTRANEIPENVTLANIASFTRSYINMTSLGGISLSSVSDIATMPAVLKEATGLGWAQSFSKGLTQAVRVLPKGVQAKVYSTLDVFTESFIQGLGFDRVINKFNSDNANVGKFMNKASNTFFKLTGLPQITDNLKKAFTMALSHEWGLNKSLNFNELHADMRFHMNEYGIKADDWNLIREFSMTKDMEKDFFAFDLLHDIPDEVLLAKASGKLENFKIANEKIKDSFGNKKTIYENNKVEAQLKGERGFTDAENRAIRMEREDLKNKVFTYFSRFTDKATLSPDTRILAKTRWGTRKGTVAGELLRSAMQFKSYPIAFLNEIMWPIIKGLPHTSTGDKLHNIAVAMTTYTALGMVSVELKRLARGDKPIFMGEDKTLMQKGKFVLAGFLQGGGAGLYGDFLFATNNRFGGGPLESFMGPSFGIAGDFSRIFHDAKTGEFKGADMFRFAKDNTPFLNLFYTRALLEYLFLNDAQEFFSPNSLSRQQQNREKETGRESWINPSQNRQRPFTG